MDPAFSNSIHHTEMRRSPSPNIDVDTSSLLKQLTKYIKEVGADKEAKTEGNYNKNDRTKTNLGLTQPRVTRILQDSRFKEKKKTDKEYNEI